MKTHFIFPFRFQTDIKLVEVQVVGEIHIRKEKQLQCHCMPCMHQKTSKKPTICNKKCINLG